MAIINAIFRVICLHTLLLLKNSKNAEAKTITGILTQTGNSGIVGEGDRVAVGVGVISGDWLGDNEGVGEGDGEGVGVEKGERNESGICVVMVILDVSG